ncbi:DeoR/GlpR family DNA-binding transcription regulator [Psittacicella hinzii]|uniref:HTH deoR-type domain-containing protein n=1 Tax=Psittacicella hinzii TaxID=2028575 RepID=A0A3A1YGB0_9GAMM|nr:DeoR/GlpR family DNA-binding transcription regulator [Psittacicella hinzii]RIY35087.1 hypothetical protein CKF58_07120 [Psittacicella hinzii]
MRKKVERLEKIAALVEQREFLSIDEISEHFKISKITVRRDLSALEKQGKLVRKFGGAVSVKELVNKHMPEFKLNLSSKGSPDEDVSIKRKRAIAKEAASLIQSNGRIIIDAGSTTGQMLNYLDGKERLSIMTNSLQIGFALSQIPVAKRPQILLTGGAYDSATDSFQGTIINEVLKHYSFDLLFIGADGIDFASGTTTQNEGLNYSSVMADISERVIVLIESSKIGTRRLPTTELKWEQIDTIITDSHIDKKYARQILKNEVRLIIADVE